MRGRPLSEIAAEYGRYRTPATRAESLLDPMANQFAGYVEGVRDENRVVLLSSMTKGPVQGVNGVMLTHLP